MNITMKYIAILTAACFTAIAAYGSEADFVKGVDMSAKTNISGSLLNQLVDNATTATNKGIVIRQSTTPDTAGNPRYTNFLWLDMSTVPPILKCYDGTNWVATIQAAGSVGNASLAGSAVTYDKIAGRTIQRTNLALLSVSGQEIDFGTIAHGNMGAASVGRDNLIGGSVGSAQLTNGAVAMTNLADNAVGTTQITNGAVTSDKIAASTIGYGSLNTNAFTYAQVGLDGTAVAKSGITSIAVANGGAQGVYYVLTFSSTRNGTNYLTMPSVIGAPWVTCSSVTNTTTAVTLRMYNTAGTTGISNAFNVMIFDPQVP